jgi:sialate O-acetylesterase
MNTKRNLITLFFLLTCNIIFGQNLHLAGIFGDGMVVQQGINAPVWGWTTPNTDVKVEFDGFITSAKAGQDGKWMVRMPILDYGGPFEMKVMGGSDTLVMKDVMIGEVWLASGQSNMEWSVGAGVGTNTESEMAGADFPNIRYYNVPRKTSCIPLSDIAKQSWNRINPTSVKDLSAVAYFFAKELHRDKKIAVGIINSSWGATSVEAWMSAEILATHPDFRDKVFQMNRDQKAWDLFVKNSVKTDHERDSLARLAQEGIKAKVYAPEYNDATWKKSNYPVSLESIGLGGYWGLVWFRKNIEIPKEALGENLKFRVVIMAKDVIIYWNGSEIGRTVSPSKQVEYNIPKKLIKKGKNVLAIRMYENWGYAWVGTSDTEAVIISKDQKIKIPLDGEWSSNSTIEPSLAQWQGYFNYNTVQYNGRIAPIIPYGIKGVIWYQGENNAGKAYQYRALFPMMIEDWRIRWGNGYMPFLFVQLANYKAKKAEPSNDNWAELREAQAMTLRYPNTGMACAIDIGEANDIHPKNKLDVGKRLYLAARKVAYHENVVSSGPVYESMKVDGSKIRLKFTSIGSGLVVKDKGTLKGFAISGSDRKFYWAEAVVEGNEVVVSSSKVPFPEAVRYSWEINPEGNLYNKDGLPAPPFRTDDWKGITE